jgi:hypothetical protein
LLIDWLWCGVTLRTAATNGRIVHPRRYMWARRATMMMMMPSGCNSWLVQQSWLAVLPAETSGASRRNGRRRDNVTYSVHETSQRICYMPYKLTTWDLRLYFPSEVKCAADCIALKNPSPRPGLNPLSLDPVASTLTTTPWRRLVAPPGYFWRHTLVYASARRSISISSLQHSLLHCSTVTLRVKTHLPRPSHIIVDAK